MAVYMGVKQAHKIRNQMLRAGIDKKIPAALIADGTTDSQQTIIATLDELPAMAMQCNANAPGLFIIGQVVALGSRLAWFNIPAAMAEAA